MSQDRTIGKDMTIEQAMELCPKALYTFVRYSIEPCGCGEELTIEEAARAQGVNVASLLDELNRRMAGEIIRNGIAMNRNHATD